MRDYEGRGVAGVHPNRGVVVVPEVCQRDRGCGRKQGVPEEQGCGRYTRGVSEE